MKPRSGSASEFILQTLREHHDRELRIRDLIELAGGRFKPGNIALSTKLLHGAGLIVRFKDGHESWWAVALERGGEA